MTGIQSFFDLLRKEGGAVWLEQENIRLSTPQSFRNKVNLQFIRDKQERIISLLRENRVYSAERFLALTKLGDRPLHKLQGPFRLLRPFQPKRNHRLPSLICIHPGQAGCEVYRPLAEMLAGDFNCAGIDNYNLHHTEKILSLPELAAYYLSVLPDKNWLQEPVNLLGWSLGGHIALEMAGILEKNGYRHINVFLLDTFLPGPPAKYKRNEEQELEALEIEELAEQAVNDADKMAATLHAEYLLASMPVSRYLKYTGVLQFRAMRQHPSLSHPPEIPGQVTATLPENHVYSAAKTVETIELDCDHYDMLDTSSEIIAEYILSVE